MEPLDPLDELLRGRSTEPRWERWRSAAVERRPWVVAAAVIALVSAVVLVVRTPTPTAISLPRATGAPASGPSPSTAAGSGPTTTTSPDVVVHVAGAVLTPGLVRLAPGARVADAVELAGGWRADADLDRVNLAAPVADGARVFIPAIGQPDPLPGAARPGGAAPTGGPGAAAVPGPVDLNTATVAELDALPGVGPSTASAIVGYRDEHGRFRSVDELQEVRGIGPAKFETLRTLVVAS